MLLKSRASNWFASARAFIDSAWDKAPLLLLINPTRDSLYNNTIGITIRLAVQIVSY